MSAELSLEMKPKLAPKTKLRLDHKTGKHILLYPEKGLLLNATGTAVLQRCTGEQTLSAIISALSLEFAIDADTVRAEVVPFVQGLLDRGLLQDEP